MVLIISQMYKGTFGDETKNIINMGVVEDLKVFKGEDNMYTICASSQGCIDKFICKCIDEDKALETIQAMYTAHVSKEPSNLMSVDNFIPKELVKEDVSIEEIEDIMFQLLDHYGHGKIVDLYFKKISDGEGGEDGEQPPQPPSKSTTLDNFIQSNDEPEVPTLSNQPPQTLPPPVDIHSARLREYQ